MPITTEIRGVLFDWAGTTIDFGSRAPTQVFRAIFRERGVEITEAEARGPMGLHKRDHIAAVARLPRVAEAWREAHGRPPNDADVRAMYDEFLPLQKSALAAGSDVIPGVVEAVAALRSQGIAIGSSTGYTRELMDVVVPLAARQGYSPDVVLCADEVAAGRPAPWMNFRAAELLGVYPMSAVLVVDDTAAGIEAGRHAGSPTVAIIDTGNSVGLSQQELASLSADELAPRLAAAEETLRAAGADYVLPSVAALPELLRSERPR